MGWAPLPGMYCHHRDKQRKNKGKSINTLSPNINMHILLSVLHIFLMVIVKRICTNVTVNGKTYLNAYPLNGQYH